METPSEDEPASEQDLQQSLLDQPVAYEEVDTTAREYLTDEESESDRSVFIPEAVIGADLMERAAESTEPTTPQDVLNFLIEHMSNMEGYHRTEFYNALRILAEATGAALPIKVLNQQTCTTARQVADFLLSLDADYREYHSYGGARLSVFGPVVWEPVDVLLCQAADNTIFVCFNQPARDPAPT